MRRRTAHPVTVLITNTESVIEAWSCEDARHRVTDPSPLVIEFWSCEDARHAREKLIILSAIPEIMEKLGYDETEALRMLASVCPPEVAALAGDDWETNPLTLDLLKILREPNGNRKIMEAGLECGAAAYGVSVEETLLRICLLPDVSLETKFELARIARDRGLPGVVLVFSSPDRR